MSFFVLLIDDSLDFLIVLMDVVLSLLLHELLGLSEDFYPCLFELAHLF